uniref:Uncharacterized protein n=1 Tax=Daphnia galeata TaxID=27404 RepID=A0A8J2WJZ2_9CRUS|nr:unnamed protein product [Daphnia galeata]
MTLFDRHMTSRLSQPYAFIRSFILSVDQKKWLEACKLTLISRSRIFRSSRHHVFPALLFSLFKSPSIDTEAQFSISPL